MGLVLSVWTIPAQEGEQNTGCFSKPLSRTCPSSCLPTFHWSKPVRGPSQCDKEINPMHLGEPQMTSHFQMPLGAAHEHPKPWHSRFHATDFTHQASQSSEAGSTPEESVGIPGEKLGAASRVAGQKNPHRVTAFLVGKREDFLQGPKVCALQEGPDPPSIPPCAHIIPLGMSFMSPRLSFNLSSVFAEDLMGALQC